MWSKLSWKLAQVWFLFVVSWYGSDGKQITLNMMFVWFYEKRWPLFYSRISRDASIKSSKTCVVHVHERWQDLHPGKAVKIKQFRIMHEAMIVWTIIAICKHLLSGLREPIALVRIILDIHSVCVRRIVWRSIESEFCYKFRKFNNAQVSTHNKNSY